jgi:endonuclease/exonuclease/phosphatase family metal-dependent hydrolase
VVNGHELVVISSHWSSRISDKKGETRGRYGDQIHGRYRAMYKGNAKVDFLVCGDFNDNPDDKSVTDHLRAVDDLDAVKKGGDVPKLFDCFAKAYADGQGSHYYKNKPFVFDHICVSPGLLDNAGWTCLTDTATIVPEIKYPRGKAPNRFGGPSDKRPFSKRGASDHFPVTVKLRVAAK